MLDDEFADLKDALAHIQVQGQDLKQQAEKGIKQHHHDRKYSTKQSVAKLEQRMTNIEAVFRMESK